MIKYLTIIPCFIGLGLWLNVGKNQIFVFSLYSLRNFLNKKFYIDNVYNIFGENTLKFGYFQYKGLDRGLLEWGNWGNKLINLNIKINGYIIHYILIIFIGICFLFLDCSMNIFIISLFLILLKKK